MKSRLRARWRRARSSPALRPFLEAADRAWWAHIIRRADIVDLDLVAAQGFRRSVRAAVSAYVRGGFRTGMILNPLVQERLVAAQLSDVGRVPALYAYLINDHSRIVTSVNWDARSLAGSEGANADPAGPVGNVWRAALDDRTVSLDGADVAGASLRSTAIDAAARARRGSTGAPIGAMHSDIVALFRVGVTEDASDALRIAGEFAAEGASVVIALEANADQWVSAALLRLRFPDIQIVPEERDLFARIAAASHDAVVVVRGPYSEIDADGLHALVRTAGTGRTVAPLWLDGGTGTIVSAGVVFHGGCSHDLLHDHPPEDAASLPAQLLVPLHRSPTFAVRGRPTVSVVLTDVINRAPEAPLTCGHSRPDTDVGALLAPTGLAVRSWRPTGPLLTRAAHEVALSTGERVPRLRWAIKIAAPPGRRGEWWGDTHFARGIADALRRLGQEVVIDAYEARDRSSSYLDDVVLALRGPEPILARPAGHSILWVISHPDQISEADVAFYDSVYAASLPWAAEASVRFGRAVRPLLQCTDAQRFRPSGVTRGDELLFVGTARGIPRPSVIEPLKAGVSVAVYGPDWSGWIPGAAIRGSGVPNADLPRMYQRAKAVLNDHWPAMRTSGFVSNRLFDVVGAGGRSISDNVAGIADLFEGAVATYDSVDELLAMVTGDLDASFPTEDELLDISDRVRIAHSFDARARELLDTVLRE